MDRNSLGQGAQGATQRTFPVQYKSSFRATSASTIEDEGITSWSSNDKGHYPLCNTRFSLHRICALTYFLFDDSNTSLPLI
jgi:hypothetical protein